MRDYSSFLIIRTGPKFFPERSRRFFFWIQTKTPTELFLPVIILCKSLQARECINQKAGVKWFLLTQGFMWAEHDLSRFILKNLASSTRSGDVKISKQNFKLLIFFLNQIVLSASTLKEI